jgi:hypothetical protein
MKAAGKSVLNSFHPRVSVSGATPRTALTGRSIGSWASAFVEADPFHQTEERYSLDGPHHGA